MTLSSNGDDLVRASRWIASVQRYAPSFAQARLAACSLSGRPALVHRCARPSVISLSVTSNRLEGTSLVRARPCGCAARDRQLSPPVCRSEKFPALCFSMVKSSTQQRSRQLLRAALHGIALRSCLMNWLKVSSQSGQGWSSALLYPVRERRCIRESSGRTCGESPPRRTGGIAERYSTHPPSGVGRQIMCFETLTSNTSQTRATALSPRQMNGPIAGQNALAEHVAGYGMLVPSAP